MFRALPVRLGPPPDAAWLVQTCFRLSAAFLLIAVGYLLTAGIGGIAPFAPDDAARAARKALSELPDDFMVPQDARLEYAGEGERLPYRLVWTSALPVTTIGSRYQAMLEDGWELMFAEEALPAYRVRIARVSETGEMTHWALLNVEPLAGGGSRISLEFIVTGGAVQLR